MKYTFAALALASTVAADLLTYTSSYVSSTCLLLQRYYGNSTEALTIIYETELVTAQDTVTLIKTVCSGGECYVTTELDVLTTVVTTVDGVLTTYVTAVPVAQTSEAASETSDIIASEITTTATTAAPESSISEAPEYVTVTDIASTVVTITSCSDHKCLATVVTTGLTTVTTEVDGVATEYVTYCPLSTEATSTVTQTGTTIVTITSCSDHKCSRVPVTTGYVVATTTINNMETVYTTFCPLTEDTTSTKQITTVVTVTSCNEKSCTNVPVTTGATVVTTTIGDITTVYTTYCPLTSEETTETSTTTEIVPTTQAAPTSSAVQQDTTKTIIRSITKSPESTVNVITNNIMTQSTVSSTALPTALVSSYEGGANRVLPVAAGLVPVLFLLM